MESGNGKRGGERRYALKFTLILLILVAVVILSIAMGRYSTTPGQFFEVLAAKLGGREPDVPQSVVDTFIRLRIPRICVALLAGAGLSIAGCAYQGAFRNPMASPEILGATTGAGFGAAIALLVGLSKVGVQLVAFACGIVAVLMVFWIAKAVGSKNQMVLTLVLSGLVVSSLFRAGISLIKTAADPFNKLPAITYWLLGSLSTTTKDDVWYLLVPVALASVPLLLLRWRINLLSFGDEEASSMGINPSRIRIITILCSSIVAAAVVSVGGMIEWVGLIIPHLARTIVGPDYKALMPASFLVGGAFLLMVDDLARSLLPSEISLGILTALVGTPVFIFLLYRQKKAREGGLE